MSGQSENPPEGTPERMGVMSPFRNVDGGTAGSSGSPLFKTLLIVLSGAILVLLVITTALLLWRQTINDPYRTLEVFSTEKYLENPSSFIGNHFKATLRVEGDLGWSPEDGKLMVFSTKDDPRYIPVLIQGGNLGYSFNKGQTYTAQLQVREGGLICATELKKN